jgi:hypothetical protein
LRLDCFSDDARTVMFADNGLGGALQRHPSPSVGLGDG